jgi:small subunit ribosomal protein S7
VSGKKGYAQRVASELIAVVEGRSGVWERRNMVHKLGISSRANIVLPRRR